MVKTTLMKNSAFKVLLILLGLTLALSLLSAFGAQRKPRSQTHSSQTVEDPCPAGAEVDADGALEKLKAGNMRWQSKMEERNWSEEREEMREIASVHPHHVRHDERSERAGRCHGDHERERSPSSHGSNR